MKIRAYAKINLGLHILGKRSDGYHSLETVFRLINEFDELDIVGYEGEIRFVTDDPALPVDNTNLCVRAAHLLQDLTGTHAGAEISLAKKIPIGAGLGGGSSDAAAVLKGLTKLWSLDISNEELRTVSATLGSDVPFFFTGQTAFATGRGELLTPFDLALPHWIVVATPPIHVSTAWAYSKIIPHPGPKRPDLRTMLERAIGRPDTLQSALLNDFETVVFERYPEIAALKKAILAAGATFAMMSGSGSSVFGLFLSAAQAQEAASRLSGNYTTSITEPLFKPELN